MLENAFILQFWLIVAKDGVNFLVSHDNSCWCTLSPKIILKRQVLITTRQYFAFGGMLLKHVNASNFRIKGRRFTLKTDNSRHCSTMEAAKKGDSIKFLLLLWVENPRQGQEILRAHLFQIWNNILYSWYLFLHDLVNIEGLSVYYGLSIYCYH